MDIALDTFISLDIETTGLDPQIDRITEIGAVKYISGEKADTFSSLVNPGFAIPYDITELTGITDKMVESAPSIEDVILKFEKFLGENPVIIGQNIRFDISFLKRYVSLSHIPTMDNYFIDTAVIARLVWPGLKKYSLVNLVELTGMTNPGAHRALPDAEATALLYLYELAALKSLPQNINSFVAGLMFGEPDRGAVLSSIASMSANLPDAIDFKYNYGDNVIGASDIEPTDDYIPIDTDSINETFDNKFRNILDDYEERPQQLEMASQAAGAFNRSEILLAEAPTGIGKSLAYLVPSINWAHLNGEGVVISTQTKNLQDQLFNKDIPLVKRALEFDFKAVLLKGRGNYLCLFKYYEILNEAIRLYDAEQRLALLPLLVWAETTKTGDIAECTGFNQKRNRYLWSRISCEGNFCLGRACSYYKRCFLYRIKNEAQTAHVKVVNHYLLFADFAVGGELIQTSGHAILDEAHNLEKVAASYLGPVINHFQFTMLFNDIFTIRPVETGFLALVKLNASTLEKDQSKQINASINRIQRTLLTARSDTGNFFDKLTSSVLKQMKGRSNSQEIRYFDLSKYVSDDLIKTCSKTLKELESLLDNFTDDLDLYDDLKDKNILGIRCRAIVQDLIDLRKSFEFLVFPDDDSYVYWIDLWKKKEVKLVSAPLEVGKILDENFYDRLKTLILSSATLSVAGNFSFVKKRLGLDLSSSERTCNLALDSPFKLDENIGFFEASYMPLPNSNEFENKVSDTVFELFSRTGVKGMVLFTSYKNITAVVNNTGEQLIKQGFELFVQDGNQSPFQLLSRYRQSPKGIIFGTDSFWEGVDLPGDDLELLVIAKLPFSVPDRPWIKANLEKIEKEGGNPFYEFSLPEAVIKFRQGFGRLIRKKTDRGCIVVLDSRLNGKNYGRYFSKSVKPHLNCCQSLNILVNSVGKYLKK